MTTAQQEIERMKKELAFIKRAVSAGFADEEILAEIWKAADNARFSLEAVELEMQHDAAEDCAVAA